MKIGRELLTREGAADRDEYREAAGTIIASCVGRHKNN
jgi:hypothetical protein